MNNRRSNTVDEQPILTVTELTRKIKLMLESGFSSVTLQGEISNFKRHTSGHIYFTLKDEGAQISAVLWRSRAAMISFIPADGMSVIDQKCLGFLPEMKCGSLVIMILDGDSPHPKDNVGQ